MIGIYFSGTGNTKHCVEKLVHILDNTAKTVPLEDSQITSILEQQDEIILGYPTQFSNAPFMVRDFIKRNLADCRYGKSDYEYDDVVKCYGRRALQ